MFKKKFNKVKNPVILTSKFETWFAASFNLYLIENVWDYNFELKTHVIIMVQIN